VKVNLKGIERSERDSLVQLLFRLLARVGSVGDGGGGQDWFDAWVSVDDEQAGLLQVQAIIAGQGLSDRARIRVRPKTATITFEHDSTEQGIADANAAIEDLAVLIAERELGENMATGQHPGSVVFSLSLFNVEVGVPAIEALIDELGLADRVVVEVF
jgi:hypothetical protein